VRLQDYRDFGDQRESVGAFDAVGSIEMGEHVGERWYPAYVRVLYRALRPGGRLLLQQMSRRGALADVALRAGRGFRGPSRRGDA
jgi:cyclopropane-fatty-acyl-phospholipid synthase